MKYATVLHFSLEFGKAIAKKNTGFATGPEHLYHK